MRENVEQTYPMDHMLIFDAGAAGVRGWRLGHGEV